MNSVLTPTDEEEMSLEELSLEEISLEELFLEETSFVDCHPAHAAGMDQALGFESAPVAAAVRVNSREFDFSWNTLWHSAAFSEFLAVMRHACAISMGLQMNWLRLIAPYAQPCSMRASSSGLPPTAEVLERSMDVALGVRAA